jgi:hypothetical protein
MMNRSELVEAVIEWTVYCVIEGEESLEAAFPYSVNYMIEQVDTEEEKVMLETIAIEEVRKEVETQVENFIPRA